MGYNFRFANLNGRDFTNKDLSGSDFYGATVIGANFTNANLSGCNLSNVSFAGATLAGAVLPSAHISGANYNDAELSECFIHGIRPPIPDPPDIVLPSDVETIAIIKVSSLETSDNNILGFINRWKEDLDVMLNDTLTVGRPLHLNAKVVFTLTTSFLMNQAPQTVKNYSTILANKNDECYALHKHNNQIWIVARHLNGLRHGAYRYLHALGYRWPWPVDHWKIHPSIGSHVVDASSIYEPKFTHLRVYGNGGYGNNNVPPINNDEPKERWEKWYQANAMPLQEVAIGTHVGEAFNTAFQCELREDRSMMAWFDNGTGFGRGKYPGDGYLPNTCFSSVILSKQDCTHHGNGGSYDNPPSPPWSGLSSNQPGCTVGVSECSTIAQDPSNDADTTTNLDQWGFGGLVKLFAQYRRNSLAVNINSFGSNHPVTKHISCEAADGGGYCECSKCINLLRSGPYAAYLTPQQQTQDATPIDTWVHLMNETAKYIAHWYGSNYKVSYLSYSARTHIPSVPIQPNSIIGLIPKTINDVSMTEQEWVSAWLDKRDNNQLGAFSISVDGEWLLSNANLDLPRMSPREMIADIDFWISRGVSGSSSQGTYSSACMGIHWWLAARKVWQDGYTDNLINEFFDTGFPVTKIPVKRMFERWWYGEGVFGNRFEITQDAIGRASGDLLDAQTLLNINPDGYEQARLDELKAYVHYLRLYLEYIPYYDAWRAAGSPSTYPTLDGYLDPLLHHIWSIYHFNTIHSTRVAFRHWFNSPSLSPIRTKWDVANAGADGWSTLTDYTSAELQTLIEDGYSTQPPISGVEFVAFSDDLQPLSSTGLTDEIVGFQSAWENYYRLYKAGAGNITIKARTFGQSTYHTPMRIVVYDPNGNKVVDQECSYTQFQNVDHPVVISGPAGNYRITLVAKDLSAVYYIIVPRNIPCVYTHPHIRYTGQNLNDPIYFYVPTGETKVALEFAHNATTTVRLYDNTGAERTVTHNTYLHVCDVPAGQDGKVWSMRGFYPLNSAVKPHFINCPSVFAFSPEQMMVPSELLP